MSENQRFSYFFQGYRNLTLGYNGLKLVRVKATQKKKTPRNNFTWVTSQNRISCQFIWCHEETVTLKWTATLEETMQYISDTKSH